MIPPDVIRVPWDTRLPPHLIVEFWAKIYTELQAKYGLLAADAAAAIIDFRVDEHRVGDMRYHRDAEDVAETIAIGWRLRRSMTTPATVSTPTPTPNPSTVTP